jgi:peptidyl-prolyl cis-trans isomerase D
MLDIMRKHARNWLMKVILGIIIIVFVFYFGSMRGRQQAELIAVLDGKPIVYVDFRKAYEDLLDMYRERTGRALTEELIKSLDVKRQAFNNLINQEVLLKKAEDMKIRVSNDDIKNAILSYPAFQRNGVFDNRIYEQTLRANRMTPEQFEEIQRKMMLTSQVESLIQDGIHVSDEEALDFYRLQNQKLDLDYIQISPASYATRIKPSRDEMESFLKANKGRFQVPEQLQIKYLSFTAGNYAPEVSPSEADIADYYERKKGQFKKNDKILPLAEVRDKIIDEMKQIAGMNRALEEAKKAHDTIYQEENFDRYASEKKLDVHTAGFFAIGAVPKELESIRDIGKALASLQENEISRVLQGDSGYYILKVVTRKAPYLPKLKDIEISVENQYKQEEAKKLAKKEADDLLSRLKKGAKIEELAHDKGLKVFETGFFQPGGDIPKLGSSAEMTEALFQLTAQNPYPQKVYSVKELYIIIHLRDTSKADEANFASQKEAIVNYLARTKKTEALKSWLEGSKADLVKQGRLKFVRDFKDL